VTRTMRILCIAHEFAWPPVNGYRIRLDQVLRALSTQGRVDYLAVLNDDRAADVAAVPPDLGSGRVRVVRSGPLRRSLPALLRATFGRLPRRIIWPDWGEAREVVAEWASTGYDLVWCSSDAYAALGYRLAAPVVVDLDNLEGRLLRERRRNRPPDPTRSSARRRVADVFDRVDEWRWTRLERRIARRVAATVVCSEDERSRLAVPGVAIVPNGYEPSAPPVQPAPGSAPLTLVFVGLYAYEPNRDAARRLACEILPCLRRVEPAAQVRLVGRDGGLLDDLRDLPGVTVVGEVAEVGPELARADVVAVPIRFGSGTRLKILEAFAHGRPVVSTHLGAEGLGAIDGEHALLADDLDGFAAACLRIHRDPALADRLVEAASALWEQRYRWDSVREAVAAVVGHAARPSEAAGPESEPAG